MPLTYLGSAASFRRSCLSTLFNFLFHRAAPKRQKGMDDFPLRSHPPMLPNDKPHFMQSVQIPLHGLCGLVRICLGKLRRQLLDIRRLDPIASCAKIQRQVPASRVGCAVPVFENLMDVIAPHDVPLLRPHKIQLLPQTIDKAAHGVNHEDAPPRLSEWHRPHPSPRAV